MLYKDALILKKNTVKGINCDNFLSTELPFVVIVKKITVSGR